MKTLHLWAALWLVPGLGVFAQSPSQPKQPLLHRAPDFASWTITLTYKPGDGAKSAEAKPVAEGDSVQSITVTKTNKTYREQETWKSGKTEEKWIFDGVQLRMVPGTTVIVPVEAPGPDAPNPYYSDYSRSDFKDLTWLSLANYQGIQTYEGKPAYLFESTESGHKLTAYLTVDTQLPLFLSDEATTCAFVYNTPPSDPLTPPANFMHVFDNYKKGINSLTRHPPSP